jgi:hypothetical protein
MATLGNLLRIYLTGDVLDVCCDAKYVSDFVQGRYVGVDIAGSPEIRVNVEAGLPFQDKTFDTVLAFDILEHLDYIYSAFAELCRVSRSYVIVGLPNMYEWHFLILFMSGKNISGKYGLCIDPPVDRHRWLFNLDNAENFLRQNADKHGFAVLEEALGYYGYRQLFAKFIILVGRMLSPHRASFFAYYYFVVLARKDHVSRNVLKDDTSSYGVY